MRLFENNWLRLGMLASVCTSGPVFAQVVETPLYTEAEQRIGFQYRQDVNAIYGSIANDGMDVSLGKLAPIIAYCEAQERPERRVVSVATEAEYENFIAEQHDGQPTEWIDIACPSAYHLQGYLYSGAKQWSKALPWLEHAIRLAPYYPTARNERAYVFAHSGHFQEGLAEYRTTLQLADAYPSAAYIKPLALRGIGWILIELGDFNGAQGAYEESLKADPDNELAKRELEYILAKRKNAAEKAPGG